MTRDEGDPEEEGSGGAAADPKGLAEAETRLIADDGMTVVDDGAAAGEAETRIVEDAAPPRIDATAPAADPAPTADAGVDAEASTVLADDDDRTHVVSRDEAPPAGSAAASSKTTRVLDPAVPPDAAGAPSDAETRVLDATEDKTAPPPVEPPTRAPARIDVDRGLEPGTILFGEYEIVNVLGVGGMGEVYRARHRRLDEHRAIKVMHAELSKKKGASEFFYREAKALLAVRHPAVVHCHDLLSDDEGRVYLIMEMIEGIPLSKKMNEGPLSADDVAILGARVAHGLAAAHRKGVIHRDVSPDNIVLPNGRVEEAKLIDFGIAKILQQGEGTIVDGFKGKLSYASPEQLGFFGGKIEGSSDVYSLGLVLVAAALGRPMSMGTTVMEAVDARRAFQALPDEIPVGLRSAIQPLLALDPKDRPKYVDRLFVVPDGMAGGTDPGGYGRVYAGSQPATTAPTRGRGVGLFAAGAAAVVGVAGIGFFVAMGDGLSSRGAVDESTAGPAASGADRASAIDATATPEGPPEPSGGAEVAAVVGGGGASSPDASSEVAEPDAATAPAKPAPVPAKPAPRRVSASDRIKIIGLLSNAGLALEENRLMSPAGDNAYDRYRRVLDLDPGNAKARDGLRAVADRYRSLAQAADARGDAEQASTFMERARTAASYAR
jgi:serine/threonine-protein kinase